jgi:NADH:ubiquinone oxidoreductase subunit K
VWQLNRVSSLFILPLCFKMHLQLLNLYGVVFSTNVTKLLWGLEVFIYAKIKIMFVSVMTECGLVRDY